MFCSAASCAVSVIEIVKESMCKIYFTVVHSFLINSTSEPF